MLGKPIKSGLQIKTERMIIDGTNPDGYLPKSAIKSLNNLTLLRKTLVKWRYEPVYKSTHAILGWQIKTPVSGN